MPNNGKIVFSEKEYMSLENDLAHLIILLDEHPELIQTLKGELKKIMERLKKKHIFKKEYKQVISY